MPNRILRDGILTSPRIAALPDPMAELFYRRLMSVVDDFGRYTADPAILLSHCFPTRPTWANVNLVSQWLSSAVNCGLLLSIDSEVIQVVDFNERIRSSRTKWLTSKEKFTSSAVNCAQLHASRARSESNTNALVKERNSLLDDFVDFFKAWTSAGMTMAPVDERLASMEWRVLDFGQKAAAIAGVSARRDAGEFDDPQFVPYPQNYLRNHLWERPVRERKKSKLDKVFEHVEKMP